MSPTLRDAVTDPRLKGAEFRILSYLHYSYGSSSGRCEIVKLWAVSKALGMNRRTVARSLRTLAELGYVRAGPQINGAPRCYEIGPPTESRGAEE